MYIHIYIYIIYIYIHLNIYIICIYMFIYLNLYKYYKYSLYRLHSLKTTLLYNPISTTKFQSLHFLLNSSTFYEYGNALCEGIHEEQRIDHEGKPMNCKT